MSFPWKRLLLAALALYIALFALAFIRERQHRTPNTSFGNGQNQQGDVFAVSRKNYASAKTGKPEPSGQPLGDVQKYERVASLSQQTTAFDSDRVRLDAAIAAQLGIVQLERGSGLVGHRVLYLGIGVPPDRFDAFIAAARAIGKTALITTVKNDKTNDYLQLRAKRTTLEKTRAALEALQGAGGSIDERIHVQSELAGVEEKIQELGVSLGDFDSQNELCTVRLTLEEAAPPIKASLLPMVMAALSWATLVFVGITSGFAAFMLGSWVAIIALRQARQMLADKGP